MKNKPTRFFAFLYSVFLFFSCTAPIDLYTKDSEPVIVIYGCLTNENKSQNIRVTRSSPYFSDTENPVVPDARVWVTASNGREYPFDYDRDGNYLSRRRFAATPGVTYRLSVEIDENQEGSKELYEAETTTLPITPADSINVTSMNIMGFNHYSLNIFMQEPPETENYYLFNYIINDSISNDKITDYIISDDQMINGEYISGASVIFFNDAADFEEFDTEDWNILLVSQGDRIRLQILNIEKGYYQFISQCMTEKHGENPFFGGPPSNIYTNLSNGAIGYFTSYCLQEKATVIP